MTSLVTTLELAQPAVSKHLAVLRRAGLVAVNRRGRQRLYRVEARELKAMHAWIATFERFWDHKLDRITQLAEAQRDRTTIHTSPTVTPQEPPDEHRHP